MRFSHNGTVKSSFQSEHAADVFKGNVLQNVDVHVVSS